MLEIARVLTVDMPDDPDAAAPPLRHAQKPMRMDRAQEAVFRRLAAKAHEA